MKFSFNTCRFVLVLAAVCNAATVAVLRGNSPTTKAATPVESLDEEAQSRMLLLAEYTGLQANLAVHSGGGIVFTSPPTAILRGDVCADLAFTGRPDQQYTLATDPNGDAYTASKGGCSSQDHLAGYLTDALSKTAKPVVDAGAMGGKTFTKGTHFAEPTLPTL